MKKVKVTLMLLAFVLVTAIGCNDPQLVSNPNSITPTPSSESTLATESAAQDLTVKQGRNPFGITKTRIYEQKSDKTGTFRVEGFKNNVMVMSLQWTFSIDGENEVWRVEGKRRDVNGALQQGELIYGTLQTIDRLSTDPNYATALKWFFDEQAIQYPGWMGNFNFTTGSEKWKLITKSSCPSCSSGIFCNC